MVSPRFVAAYTVALAACDFSICLNVVTLMSGLHMRLAGTCPHNDLWIKNPKQREARGPAELIQVPMYLVPGL